MIWIYLVCIAALYYIYDGYLRVLQTLHVLSFTHTRASTSLANIPVTILVTVYNEEHQIVERIKNILTTTYNEKLIHVLIASDGSTDRTDQHVRDFKDTRVELFIPLERGGKSFTQNGAMERAIGDVVVFTDADTRFDVRFIEEIMAPFLDEKVGAVDGHLHFISDSDNELSKSQGFYWAYELRLREFESALGLLAVGSGACLAVRKKLFKNLDPAVGEDCSVPLDVVGAGYRVVHASRALAYDRMDNSVDRELNTRVRMTARNWRGTWKHPALLNPLLHPGYAFALWSHKIIRWLSPFILIVIFLSSIQMGLVEGGLYWALIIAPAGIAAGGITGWFARNLEIYDRGLGVLHSFCIANLGFFLGVLKACFGRPITKYK